MISRRFLFLLAPLVILLDQPCAATTANSLAHRIAIDGNLADWESDEWVLDASTVPVGESGSDSRWGESEEILRVGVTWDAQFLYLAVEFRADAGAVMCALGYGPGGLTTLDGAGTLRRTIDFPFAANLLALATTRGVPALARVDDRGVLTLLDRATAPAVVRAPLEGAAGFEAAIPWSIVSLAQPLAWTVALSGSEEGTGAGDAAPDPSVGLPETRGPSSTARASLDRWLAIVADADADGTPDPGVSPRVTVTVAPSAVASSTRDDDVALTLAATPRVFAPDRGEATTFTVGIDGGLGSDEFFATARVYSVDGSLVRVLYEDQARMRSGSSLAPSPLDAWDGRDDGGRIVAGGVYVVSFEWGLVRGERAGRATAGVAVAR